MEGNLKIAICDDEAIYRDKLYALISAQSSIYIVEQFPSGKALLASSVFTKYDIIFLDIEIKDSLGVDIAQEVRILNPDVLIFFVTSYTEYISDAFKSGPFQYLIKPIDENLFVSEFNRAINSLSQQRDSLQIQWGATTERLRIGDIECIEFSNRKIVVHMSDGTIKFASGTLKYLKDALIGHNFAQIHNSFYVNLKHVQKIKGYEIYTLRNIALPISKKFIKTVKTQLSYYLSGVCL